MSNTLTGLRYTLRQLRRSPGFALTAMITLALSIGATTAMYSFVRSTLLAPLPYPHSLELVGIGFAQPVDLPTDTQTGEAATLIGEDASTFVSTGVADGGPLGANFSSGNGGAQSIRALRVLASYLHTLGANPILGHTFTRDEDLPGASPIVLISEQLWRNVFHADPAILGRVVHINKDPYTVIGVMPSSLVTFGSPDVWDPLHLSAADPGYQGTNYQMIARLKPGVMLQQAVAESDNLNAVVYRKIPAVDPEVPVADFAPMQSYIDKNVAAPRSFSWLAGAFTAFALGLTLIGLFDLLSNQVTARTRELGVRMALGAQRLQVLALALINGLSYTVLGLVAIAGSFALRGVIVSLLYDTVTGLDRSGAAALLGNRAIVFPLVIGAMLVAALAASLVPGRRAAHLYPMEALRNE